MLPKDWLEYVAAAERDIKKPSDPPKRRQPKIKRMTSRRQRTAESQTANTVRAVYQPESKWNATPTQPEDWKGTHEVGPGDVHNPNSSWRTGKATVEPISPSYSKVQPRTHSTGPKQQVNIDKLMEEFG